MNSKPILIAHGEPNSIFLEIFFKLLISKKFKNPLILVCSQKLLKFQMKKLKFKMSIRILNLSTLNKVKLNNKTINVIDINYNEKLFFKVVKLSFQQRRKTLRNSLKSFNFSDILREDAIFDLRPEQLSVRDFIYITDLIDKNI